MRPRSPILRTRLIAVLFVTSALLLRAEDEQTAPDGSKIVPVTVGGRTILVKEDNIYRNIKAPPPPDGHYHPSEVNFSAKSTMGDKTFALPADTLSKGDPEFQKSAQESFTTKPYADAALSASVPNLDAKPNLPTTSAYSRSATGFDKSYLTASANSDQNRTSPFSNTASPDQGRTAALNEQNSTATYADPFANKKFTGPEADAVHHALTKMQNGQMLVTDLPNRPLTIDEVRELINHGFKPNTDEPPAEEASKPLNDPNYKPEPLRDIPQPDSSAPANSGPLNDDDKNDPVPPPGTMAAPPPPENSQPLPQP